MRSVLLRSLAFVGILSLLVAGAMLPGCLPPLGDAAAETTTLTSGTLSEADVARLLADLQAQQLDGQELDPNRVQVVFVSLVPGKTGETGPAGPPGDIGPAGPPGLGAPLVGEVRMWAGAFSKPPAGWMVCDGRELSRTAFAELFAVVGDAYGAGDETTTFNLPDFRNRSPMGADRIDELGHSKTTVEGDAAAAGGSATRTLTVGQLPPHTHDMTHSHDLPADPNGFGFGTSAVVVSDNATTTFTIAPVTQATGSTGSGQPISVLDPYFAISFIIFTGGTP